LRRSSFSGGFHCHARANFSAENISPKRNTAQKQTWMDDIFKKVGNKMTFKLEINFIALNLIFPSNEAIGSSLHTIPFLNEIT
jgi:hypothetical protein